MFALAVLALFVGSAYAQSTIKIGGIWTLADITGKQGSAAAQLAVEEINAAGGVLGKSSNSSSSMMRARPTRPQQPSKNWPPWTRSMSLWEAWPPARAR